MANLKKIAVKEINNLFKELGFTPKDIFHVRRGNNKSILFFCKDLHIRDGQALVGCSIGVSFEGILKMEKTMIFRDIPSYNRPAIMQSLSLLIPTIGKKHYWVIAELINGEVIVNHKELKILREYIEEYGYAFHQEYSASMDAIAQRLEVDIDLMVNREETLPIIYYLQRNKAKGLEFIENELIRQATPQIDPNAKTVKQGSVESIIVQPGWTFEDMKKAVKEHGSITFIVGDGVVSPEYLKFAECYKELPDDVDAFLASVKLKI